MKKPIISICIPTKNRYKILEKTIESAVKQKEFLEGDVELVISDNASEDKTESIVRKYASDYSQIKYYRNNTDVGAINFIYALQKGTGEYRKLSNDSIHFKDGAFSVMVDLVNRYREEKPVLAWRIYGRNNVSFKEVNDWDSFFRMPSFFLTWIGSYGIWEEDINDIESDYNAKKDALIERLLTKEKGDVIAEGLKVTVEDICPDPFWHIRNMIDSFEIKNKAVYFNLRPYLELSLPSKIYKKGLMKWFFYDYYLDILKENVKLNRITDKCYDDLRRDLAFSFFVEQIVNCELGIGNISFEPGEDLTHEIMELYKDDEYYNELVAYYNACKLKVEQSDEGDD